MIDIKELVAGTRDAITVRRVYGDPVEKDGLTVIPAATVRGGGGGGGGESPGEGRSGGSGFGIEARPTGAFIIQGGTVRWQPAVDVNRVLLVAVVGLLTLRSVAKARAKVKIVRAAIAKKTAGK